MTSIAWTPSLQSEWLCRSPRRSASVTSAGRRPSRAASTSPRSSRSSGSMNGEVEEARRRPPRRGRSAARRRRRSRAAPSSSRRRKPFSDRLQPRSRAMPAQPDVVRRRPREVDEVRAGLARRHHHQVHLRAAQQPDARLRLPGAEDPVHAVAGWTNRSTTASGAIRLHEQVQVADRLAAPPQRPRLDDPPDTRGVRQLRHEVVRERLGGVEQEPLAGATPAGRSPRGSAARCRRRCPCRPRRWPASAARRRSSRLSMPRPSQTRRTVFGPTPGIRSSSTRLGRDLRAEPVVERHAAGRGELHDLVADRPADARDRAPVAGAVGGRDVERRPGDGVRGAVVGDRLERDLALDLEDVADLVEDPRQVVVGEGGLPRAPRRRRRTPAGGIGELGAIGAVGVVGRRLGARRCVWHGAWTGAAGLTR